MFLNIFQELKQHWLVHHLHFWVLSQLNEEMNKNAIDYLKLNAYLITHLKYQVQVFFNSELKSTIVLSSVILWHLFVDISN